MEPFDSDFSDVWLFWYFIYWTLKFSIGKIGSPRVIFRYGHNTGAFLFYSKLNCDS